MKWGMMAVMEGDITGYEKAIKGPNGEHGQTWIKLVSADC